MRAPALSFDAPLGDDGDGRSLAEMVPRKNDVSPETGAANNELGAIVKERLAEFADALTDEREQIIWTERMVAIDPVSLSVLGERFGRSVRPVQTD